MALFVKKCPCLRPKIEEDVRVLDYRHCSLTDVPGEVFNFERTLEELYVDSNQIGDLPRVGTCLHMHHVMRKPAFCISKNKGADQRLCFRYIVSTITLCPESGSTICCTAWLVWDWVGNPENRFSCDTTHIILRVEQYAAVVVFFLFFF